MGACEAVMVEQRNKTDGIGDAGTPSSASTSVPDASTSGAGGAMLLAGVETIIAREIQELQRWIAHRFVTLESTLALEEGRPKKGVACASPPTQLPAAHASVSPAFLGVKCSVEGSPLLPNSPVPPPPRRESRDSLVSPCSQPREELWEAIRMGLGPAVLRQQSAYSSQPPPRPTLASRSHKAWEDRMLDYLDKLTEQKLGRRRSVNGTNTNLSKLVNSGRFATLVTCVILLNTMFIGIEVQDHMNRALHDPDFEKPQMFVIINIFFAAFFALELLLSVFALRAQFFFGRGWQWNIFDLLLVVFSLVELALGPEHGSSRGYMRILRVLRVARALRVIRIVRFFRELRCLCISIVSNLVSLAWAIALLLIIIFVFAVVFMQAGVHDLQSTRDREDEWRRWYGSIGETLYTLTKSVSGGEDWNVAAQPLGEVSVFYQFAFVFYVLFVIFGALNVLTGVFLQRAMESMGSDRDWLAQAQNLKLETFVMNLVDVFHEIDMDSRGCLTWDKFMMAMDNPRTRAFFMSHDLDIADAHLVFNLMVGPDGTVSIADFVKGCSQAKGFAKSAHIMSLMRETEQMHGELRKGFEALLRISAQCHQSSSSGPHHHHKHIQASGKSHTTDPPRWSQHPSLPSSVTVPAESMEEVVPENQVVVTLAPKGALGADAPGSKDNPKPLGNHEVDDAAVEADSAASARQDSPRILHL